MKLDVAGNAKKNMFWGTVLRIYQILASFALRAALIRHLGIEYVGLGGLFSSVLNFLNLAELGVGSAVQFFLYQSVAENDTVSFRQLTGLTKALYRRIGFVITGAGLLVAPFLRMLISGELPAGINIYVIYCLNLLQTALSYWMFPGKKLVLTAYQRNDISCRISLVTSTIQYILQFLILFYLPNYYSYFAVSIFASIVGHVLCAFAADRRYPQYRIPLPTPKAVKEKVANKASGAFLHTIGGIIVTSADTLVITTFLGLSVSGKYQNYLQVMGGIFSFLALINASWRAGIGNIIACDGVEAAYGSFEHSTFLAFCISTVCCCCFLNLYQPFISFWVGEDMLLDDRLVVLLCIYFYTIRLMSPGNMLESASGIWTKDRFRPLAEGIFNLGLNLILVQFIGLYGILLSTVLSMILLSIPWLYYNVVRNLFRKSLACYFKTLLHYTVSTVVICVVSHFVCSAIPAGDDPIIDLLIKALVSVTIPFSLLYILYHKHEGWKWITEHIFRLIRLQKF